MSSKKITALLVVLILVVCIISIARESKPTVSIPTIPTTTPVATTPTTTTLCYYRSTKTAVGYDQSLMRLVLADDTVTGEFDTYPAEKDSKVGMFTGTRAQSTIGDYSSTNLVIWNSMAEGMQNKEELLISYTPTQAQAAFGEMVQGANGVYVYKDEASAVFQAAIPAIDCAKLDEITAVEAYIRNNDLKTITGIQPASGESLIVSSIVVDPSTHTALISYEDGHSSGMGTLIYTFDSPLNKVTITSFAKAK